MAIPARLPETSGDGRIDHPVEPAADRADASAGRLGQHQAVRRIWTGRRDLYPRPARSDAPGRQAGDDRHQLGLHEISDEIDRRSAADRGHRLCRRCRADPHRARVRQGRLCAVGPALLDPAAGRRRCDRQGHRQGRSGRAARSWSISSPPRCWTSSSRISRRSIAASSGSTSRPRPCSGHGASEPQGLRSARRRVTV